jgi:DNA polymerase-1
MAKTKTLLVVDGFNVLYRGFWASNYGRKPEDMDAALAVRGVISIIMSDLVFVEATHCAVVFDREGDNFRHRLYPEYKGTRERLDESVELHKQIFPLKRLINAMGIKVFGIRGQEGDDLVGSLAVSANQDDPKAQIYIGSRDKDFASLVNKRIHLLQPQKEILDEQGVFDKWGVKPSQMVEYLMLLGDGVDNIPGVYKVGPKVAAKILNTHGSIKKWLPTKKTPALHKNVEAVKDFFPTSKKLITIKTNCFPDMTLDKLRIKPYNEKQLERICKELDFHSTYHQIRKQLGKLP